MDIELIKRMMDACYQGKRIRDMLPPLPDGVASSYIQYLDIIEKLEKQGIQVKVSDVSDALSLPRPGVTRTVKDMEAKGYVKKFASAKDGRVTYLSVTEAGKALSQKYNEQYFTMLSGYMTVSRKKTFYVPFGPWRNFIRLCVKGESTLTNEKNDFTQGSILKKLALFMLPILGPLSAGSIRCRRPSSSWTLRLYIRTVCCFYRKPGTEPCYLCGDTVCYGNHSPHSPLSWRKKAGTNWLCYWRCCSCFCCNFCHTVLL